MNCGDSVFITAVEHNRMTLSVVARFVEREAERFRCYAYDEWGVDAAEANAIIKYMMDVAGIK
jgi:hypothetical protein